MVQFLEASFQVCKNGGRAPSSEGEGVFFGVVSFLKSGIKKQKCGAVWAKGCR